MEKTLVIIVTFNGLKWAKKCIDSVKQSTVKCDVIIIDNGSTDGTQLFIKNSYSDIKLIQSECNLGFGKANNIGFQYAIDNDYDYVYLLNQDAWVEKDCIETLIRVQKDNPEYGILSPMQMESNMQNLDSMFLKCLCRMNIKPCFTNDAVVNKVKTVYDIGMVMAAHWLISKEALNIVGGFSPTFPHYGEDLNYVHRMKYKGFKIGVVPRAVAVHDREFRVTPLDKLMYQYYMSELANASNPQTSKSNVCLHYLHNLFMFVKKYKTIKYLRYLPKLVRKYPIIKRNLKKTINQECSFLIKK